MARPATTPIMSPWVLLSLTDRALESVSSELRERLEQSFLERRSRTAEPKLHRRQRSPGKRSATSLGIRHIPPRSKVVRKVSMDPWDPSADTFSPTWTVMRSFKAIEGLVRPCSSNHVGGGGSRKTSQSIADRLNVKLKQRASRRPKEDTSATTPSVLDDNLADIRLKIRELRVAENRRMRNRDSFNAKQLLTEFSSVNRKRIVNRPMTSPDASTRELSGLVDVIDARLSSSESLTILRELGIEYVPRTAAGRKNVIGTGLSAALGGTTVVKPSSETPDSP